MTTTEVAASDGARDILKQKEFGDSWVSSQSQWRDRFWQFDNETAGVRPDASRIPWDVALPDGSRLTDPQWAPLLEALKRFAWSLFADKNGYYGRPLKPRSAGELATGIRYLARWMVRRNFLSFSELDNAASEVFLDDIADEAAQADLRPSDIEETIPDPQKNAAQVAEGMSVSQVFRRIHIWLQLWRQASALRQAGIPALPEAPFNGRSSKEVSRDIATRAVSLIAPLPDEVALPIMNAAHRMIGLPAAEVIRLHFLYAEGVRAAVNEGQQRRNSQNDRGVRAIKDFQFSVLPGEREPWHAPLAEAEVDDFWPVYSRGRQGPGTVSGSQLLRSLVCSIRDACSIVIQSETGLRVSELCGLEPGIHPESGLPTCVRIRRSYSGLNELFFLDGRLFKTVGGSQRHVEWLVGSRPVGSKEIPPPVRALEVLTRLLDPWRTMASHPKVAKSLFAHPATCSGMPGKSGITIAFEDTILRGQRKFVFRYVDLSELPDRNRRGEDLTVYRDSRGLCLRTHQWRKTFARYICGTDSRMLPAVSRHFKHLTLAMTEEAYLGKNPALQDAYESNINQSTARILYENARGKPAQAGRMAKLIDEHRAELQALIANKDERDGRRAIRKWVEQNRLQIFFAPHGKCFIRLDPVGARCHEVGQTVHWLNEEPHYAFRHPSLCAGCSCFLVDKENEEFWLERFIDNYRAFQEGASQGKASDYRIARERADQAAAILQALKVPLPEV
jgi:hypothetical protein